MYEGLKQRLIKIREYDEHKYWLGPASWSESVLKLVPFNKKFRYPAYLHDNGYCLPSTDLERLKYDNLFFFEMLKVCGLNPLAYLFAVVYYLLVRTFGMNFFTSL